MIAYVAGRVSESPTATPRELIPLQRWEILGVYSSRKKAEERCTTDRDFVGPVPVDTDLPEELVTWPDAYYPLPKEGKK